MSVIAKSHVDHEVKRFTWNLENLKILATNPNLRDTHVFPFSIGSTIDRASKWKFFLSPDNNNNARFPLSIAFYVQLVEYSGTEEIPIELQISVMGDNNWRYAVFLGIHKFTAASTAPMKCNITTFPLPDGTLGSIFQHGGNRLLKVFIKFQIFGKQRYAISDSDLLSPSFLAKRMNQSSQRYKEIALAMLESGEWSDVTFMTRDGQRVVAHRLILSMHSAVFAAMFAAEMKEKTDGVVNLVDMGGDALKILLKFVYTDEMDEKWGQFYGEIVNAADKYQLTSLTNICDKLLPTLVSWENCTELLKLAELHGMPGAKGEIEEFMKSDPGKLLQLYVSSSHLIVDNDMP